MAAGLCASALFFYFHRKAGKVEEEGGEGETDRQRETQGENENLELWTGYTFLQNWLN